MHVTLARMVLSLTLLSRYDDLAELNRSTSDTGGAAVQLELTGGPQAYRVYRVTAYCDRGLTASGVPSGMGQCAAPADIPFGTQIWIPELQQHFVVTDRTAERFRHNTVDLFLPTAPQCRTFGAQFLECHIYLPAQRLPYGAPELLRLAARTTAAMKPPIDS